MKDALKEAVSSLPSSKLQKRLLKSLAKYAKLLADHVLSASAQKAATTEAAEFTAAARLLIDPLYEERVQALTKAKKPHQAALQALMQARSPPVPELMDIHQKMITPGALLG